MLLKCPKPPEDQRQIHPEIEPLPGPAQGTVAYHTRIKGSKVQLCIRQHAVSVRKHLSGGCLATSLVAQWGPRGQTCGGSAHGVSTFVPAW